MNHEVIRDYLDAVASSRTPTVEDLEAAVREATAGGGHVGTPHDVGGLRRALTAATVDVQRWANEGNTGHARRVAAEHLARIVGTTDTGQQTSTVNTLGDMRAVVDSIPRI